MPKIKACEREIKNRQFRAELVKHLALCGYDKRDLAALLGGTTRTIYNKKKRPQSLTMAELRQIYKALKYQPNKIVIGL